MSRRVNAYAALVGAALVGATALTLAAAPYAFADGGGGGSSGGAGVSPPPTSNQPALGLASSSRFIGGKVGVVSPGNVTVSATVNGITIAASASTMLGSQLRITGHAPTADAGDTIELERLGHETQWAWNATALAKVRPNGSFTASWKTNHIGRFEIGVAVTGSNTTPASGPVVMVTIFRSSFATWYTLVGNHTACGELLTRKTLGVANRTLPCGERVAIYYNGRTIVVPVIDRGPYGDGADWDLTKATARALGMLAAWRATVGGVSLPRKA